MKVNKVLRYIISLAIAGLLLFYSFREVDWDSFTKGIALCNWAFVGIAALAAALAAFLRSLRWRLLIKPLDPTIDVLSTFNGVNIGYLANFVFPRVGEVIRCGFVSRRSQARHKEDGKGASFENVLGTVILSRSWDIVMVLLLILVLLICRWAKFGAFFYDAVMERFADGPNITGILLLLAVAALIALVLWLAYRYRDRSRIVRRIVDFVKGLYDGLKSCLDMEHKGLFFLYTGLMWLMYWLMSMSIVWALPSMSQLDWVDGLFICLAGSVAWMIPVPGGIGAYHGVVALALTSVYGFGWESGILYATLNHETDVIVMIITGVASYISEMIRK